MADRGTRASGSRERMKRLRERRKAEGWKSLTIEVPAGHEAGVRAAAEQARRLAEMGAPANDAEPTAAGLMARVAEVQRERDEATEARRRAEADRDEAERRRQVAERERDEATGARAEIERQRSKLESQVADLRDHQDALVADLRRVIDERDTAQRRLKTMRRAYDQSPSLGRFLVRVVLGSEAIPRPLSSRHDPKSLPAASGKATDGKKTSKPTQGPSGKKAAHTGAKTASSKPKDPNRK